MVKKNIQGQDLPIMQCSAEYLSLRKGFTEEVLNVWRDGSLAASQHPAPTSPLGGHPVWGHPVGTTQLHLRVVQSCVPLSCSPLLSPLPYPHIC